MEHETLDLNTLSAATAENNPINSDRTSAAVPIPDNADGRDPLLLASRVTPSEHITDLRRRGKGRSLKRVADFYEEQNDEIKRFLSDADRQSVEEQEEEAKLKLAQNLAYKIAIQGSFIANIFLSMLQLYAAISSGSMSLFATMADSLFDPLSNLILNLAHKTSVKWDVDKYPSGKARMETIGNVVYAFLMGTVSVVLIVESIRTVLTHEGEEVFELNIPSVISVGIAFATKFVLFLYCTPLRAHSQVQMLWEDHRNDLFVNAFGILTSVGGGKLKWWIDPAGAIIISAVILALWCKTAYEQFQFLAGVSADTSYIRYLVYKSMTFDPTIQKIDTCRAYYSGPKLIVEVDIVMDPSTPLHKAHDVGEGLQIALEQLENVERAYVHIDFETDHKPEHAGQ
ncbi:hypothetical protein HK104_006592 [Borealophlyctis nickersoniae]|nr:hypothetical protein HK104_006592 [Borealophlyctis nickersoniae]